MAITRARIISRLIEFGTEMTEQTDMTELTDVNVRTEVMERTEQSDMADGMNAARDYPTAEDYEISLLEDPFVSKSGYGNLWVWKKSMDLVDEVYTLTRSLPEEEKFGLKSQLRRAAVSVPSNIAEGYGRGTNGYFKQGLSVARGSLHEVETQLRVCMRQGYMSSDKVAEVLSLCGAISAAMVKLINKTK